MIRFEYDVVPVEVGSSRSVTLTGIIHRPGDPTTNGRIYPTPIWIRESARLEGTAVPGRFLEHGEAPPGPGFEPEFLVEEIVARRDQTVRGRFVLVDQEVAARLEALAVEGIPAGFEVCLVGNGSVRDEQGIQIVQNDYMLEAVHLVRIPSQPAVPAGGEA